MKWTFRWGSHIPVLIEVLRVTKKDVLEVGMGAYGSPILHWICASKDRRLVSYENNKRYFDLFQNGLNKLHEVFLVEDLFNIDISQEWDVAFIDSAPMEQRTIIASRIANNCKFVIVHDSEAREEKYYHYREILYPLFRYNYAYTKFKPNTTVFSNFENLDFLSEL